MRYYYRGALAGDIGEEICPGLHLIWSPPCPNLKATVHSSKLVLRNII